MKHAISIALALAVAATFGSASWAGDNGKAKGNAFGQANDGNPQFKLSPATDAPGIKNSNQVLLTNPNNACGRSIDAAPGRNPHCPLADHP